MMNRRGFFGLLGGAVAALTLDPEKALWVPGKKLISIPLHGGGRLQQFYVTGIEYSLGDYADIYLRPGDDGNILSIRSGWATEILKPGDRFTIAGMYQKN